VGYTPSRDVAARQSISLKYVEKLMPALKNARPLASSHGSGGGHHPPPPAYPLQHSKSRHTIYYYPPDAALRSNPSTDIPLPCHIPVLPIEIILLLSFW